MLPPLPGEPPHEAWTQLTLAELNQVLFGAEPRGPSNMGAQQLCCDTADLLWVAPAIRRQDGILAALQAQAADTTHNLTYSFAFQGLIRLRLRILSHGQLLVSLTPYFDSAAQMEREITRILGLQFAAQAPHLPETREPAP